MARAAFPDLFGMNLVPECNRALAKALVLVRRDTEGTRAIFALVAGFLLVRGLGLAVALARAFGGMCVSDGIFISDQAWSFTKEGALMKRGRFFVNG